MLNKSELSIIVNQYIESFDSHQNELFKWIAVKHFQDNWDDEAGIN